MPDCTRAQLCYCPFKPAASDWSPATAHCTAVCAETLAACTRKPRTAARESYRLLSLCLATYEVSLFLFGGADGVREVSSPTEQTQLVQDGRGTVCREIHLAHAV